MHCETSLIAFELLARIPDWTPFPFPPRAGKRVPRRVGAAGHERAPAGTPFRGPVSRSLAPRERSSGLCITVADVHSRAAGRLLDHKDGTAGDESHLREGRFFGTGGERGAEAALEAAPGASNQSQKIVECFEREANNRCGGFRKTETPAASGAQRPTNPGPQEKSNKKTKQGLGSAPPKRPEMLVLRGSSRERECASAWRVAATRAIAD